MQPISDLLGSQIEKLFQDLPTDLTPHHRTQLQLRCQNPRRLPPLTDRPEPTLADDKTLILTESKSRT